MATTAPPTQAPHTLTTKETPTNLRVNAGNVPKTQLGWLRPTTIDTPLDEMKQRLQTDNYLYVKGLLPREDVLEMRRHYFSQFQHTGILRPGSDPVDGIYNNEQDPSLHRGIGGGEPIGEDLKTLIAAHTTPDYRNFVAHPKLRGLVRDLMDWDEEVLLQRTMLRHNVPNGTTTGVHYDKLFLRGGDAFFLTAWVPIGDVKHNGGGLIYLEDSIELGQAIEDDFNERAKNFTTEEKISAFNANMTDTGILSNHPGRFEEDHQPIAERVGQGDRTYKWLIADYEAGDVVFHHPCSVHSSCANEDPKGRIRLSTDLRFYDKKAFDDDVQVKADTRWMRFWVPGDGL